MIRTGTVATVLLAGLLLAVVGAGAAAAEETSGDVYAVDDDHGLTENESVAEFRRIGQVTEEIEGLDGWVAVSEKKGTMEGAGDGVRPLDSMHDFVGIQYDEDISRTLRVWIPADYVTPYTREGVEAINSEHTASYQPVRGGEYLQIVVHVDEPATVVLPIHWHSEVTYGVISTYEERLAAVTGGQKEWRYLDSSGLEREVPVAVEVESTEDVVVQYDDTPEEPEETWINAPRGDGDEVFWYAPDSEDGSTIYVVSRTETAPSVRIMDRGGAREKSEGWINDARQIPDRIRGGLSDPLETLGSLF